MEETLHTWNHEIDLVVELVTEDEPLRVAKQRLTEESFDAMKDGIETQAATSFVLLDPAGGQVVFPLRLVARHRYEQ